jgi:hypothetical protein
MVLVKDSRNVLRGLTRQFGWQWTTVLDFAQATKEHGASDWWITSVDYEEVRGVAIRGADTQPATFGLMKHPIPVAFTPQLDAIQVRLPACAVMRVRARAVTCYFGIDA